MGRSLNRATLIGNVGADPEVRTTSKGSRVAQFSLATGRTWTDGEGGTHERTEWHRVVVWGRLVEVVERFVKRGERLFVEGEIHYRSYEDGEGVTRQVTEVSAKEVLLLGGRPAEAAGEPDLDTTTATQRGAAAAPVRRGRAAAAARLGGDDVPF